jgi:phage/plasmid primase-like uncharacterized protein
LIVVGVPVAAALNAANSLKATIAALAETFPAATIARAENRRTKVADRRTFQGCVPG